MELRVRKIMKLRPVLLIIVGCFLAFRAPFMKVSPHILSPALDKEGYVMHDRDFETVYAEKEVGAYSVGNAIVYYISSFGIVLAIYGGILLRKGTKGGSS